MINKDITTFDGTSYDGPFELHELQQGRNKVFIISSNGIPFMAVLNAPEIAEVLLGGLRTNNLQVVDKFEKYYVRH
jgi:hypothetical protein